LRCSTFALTASASNGVPSVNATSSRSVKSQLRPSSAAVHDSASHGMISPDSSRETSDSRNWVAPLSVLHA